MRNPTTWGEVVRPAKLARQASYRRFKKALFSVKKGSSEFVELVEATEELKKKIQSSSDQFMLLIKLLQQIEGTGPENWSIEAGFASEIEDSFELYSTWAHEAKRA
jgi:hypothetical protein